MKQHRYTYTAAVIASGALWGMIGLFIRALDRFGVGNMQKVFLRVFLSAVILLTALLIFRRELIKIRLRDLWCFVGTGCFSLAFFNVCYFYTITAQSLSLAAVLLYTAPAFVAVMSVVLFRESLTFVRVLCLGLVLVGCVFVTGVLFEDSALSVGGIMTGLGAGFGYALYSIFGRYALERGYHTLTVNLWTFLIASLCILPFARPWELGSMVLDPAFPWYAVICMVLFSTMLPYLLYTYGLQGMDGGRASVLATVEPVVATVAGVLCFQEALTPFGIVGMIMVLSAVVLLNLPISHRKRRTCSDSEHILHQ